MADKSDELRNQILKAGTVRFAAGTFSRKLYSNGTAGNIEHNVQEIVEIGINDLMSLIADHIRRAEIRARLDERSRVALDNYLGQTVSESTDYHYKFDMFANKNEMRITQLEAQLDEESVKESLK